MAVNQQLNVLRYKDKQAFSTAALNNLRHATQDMEWFLNKEYRLDSALNIVCEQYKLTEIQRKAVQTASCSTSHKKHTMHHKTDFRDIEKNNILIDGFNLLRTLESLVSGHPIIKCHDEIYRDLSPPSNSYHQLTITSDIIYKVAEIFSLFTPHPIYWLFDSRVSNHLRIASIVEDIGYERNVNWSSIAINNLNYRLSDVNSIIISSNTSVLEAAKQWLNLTDFFIDIFPSEYWIIDLHASPKKTKAQLNKETSRLRSNQYEHL